MVGHCSRVMPAHGGKCSKSKAYQEEYVRLLRRDQAFNHQCVFQ